MFKKLGFAVFLILIFCLIASSFFPQGFAQQYFYRTLWFKILWAMLALSFCLDLLSLLKKNLFAFAAIYTGILFILLAGLLTSFLEEEGFMELKEGQTQQEFWINDNIAKPLDFSIYLKSFLVEFYPGQRQTMRFVKSYKSAVVINKEGRVLKEAVIQVNQPLTFEGYSFYQYGYDPDYPKQTILQVVKDPGIPFVYSGYLILLLGLIASFKKIWKI